MRALGDLLTKLPIRTMNEIRGHIVERGRRNAISRSYHAMTDDKKVIATWKLDLDRILRVFNVCSITPARPPAVFGFQVELGANAHANVSDTHQDATNENSIGSNPANTHTAVPDIHRNKLKGREGAGGRNQAVGIIRAPLVIE